MRERGKSDRNARTLEADLLTSWRLVMDGYNRTNQQLMAQVQAHGLAPQWFAVLGRLMDAPDHRLPMSKLAAEVSMTSGGLTKLVDRLEKAGFTERQHDRGDRRIVHTRLTERGEQAVRDATDTHSTNLRAVLLGALTVDEVHQMGALMQRLLETQIEPTESDEIAETATETATATEEPVVPAG